MTYDFYYDCFSNPNLRRWHTIEPLVFWSKSVPSVVTPVVKGLTFSNLTSIFYSLILITYFSALKLLFSEIFFQIAWFYVNLHIFCVCEYSWTWFSNFLNLRNSSKLPTYAKLAFELLKDKKGWINGHVFKTTH